MIRLKVKEVAQAKGISQRQLSKKSDLNENHIREMYRNPYANIKMETLYRLARALSVDPSELIAFEPGDYTDAGQE